MPPYVREILKAIVLAVADVIVKHFASHNKPKPPPSV